jgi:hypothetical protein
LQLCSRCVEFSHLSLESAWKGCRESSG